MGYYVDSWKKREIKIGWDKYMKKYIDDWKNSPSININQL
jgi:hypothetical protein